ncbi:hypothetical protein D3C85_1493870 [compost metagenome]
MYGERSYVASETMFLAKPIALLVGQPRHGLAGRKMGVGWAVAQAHDRLSFDFAQCIARRGPFHGLSGVSLNSLGFGPSLQGSEQETDFLAGPNISGSCHLGLTQPGHE